MISAREALALLREGNQRFVSEVSSRDTFESRARRLELTAGQDCAFDLGIRSLIRAHGIERNIR